LFVWAYVNFIHPVEIPAIWFGLLASLLGLLLGTFGFPRPTKVAE
jgi:hypothetical protein